MKKIISGVLSGAMLIGTLSMVPSKGVYAAPETGADGGVQKYEVLYETTYEDRKSGDPIITVTDPVLEQEEKTVLDSVNERTEDRIHYIKLNGDTSQSSDAILIESNGHYGLIDSSNKSGDTQYGIDIQDSASGKAVIEYMAEVGVDHLDFILATHAHSDHIGGIPEIAASVIATEQIDTSSVYSISEKFTDEAGNEVTITPVEQLEGTDQNAAGLQVSANLGGATETGTETGADTGIEGSSEEPEEISLNPEDYEDIVETSEGGIDLIDENTTYIFKSFTKNKIEAPWNNDRYFNDAAEAMDGCHKLMVDNPSDNALNYFGAKKNTNKKGNIDDSISFKFGDFDISLYNLYSVSNTNENTNSIVTYIEKSGVKTLLLADIDVNGKTEQEVAKAVVQQHGKVNVMKVGHHGYTFSTSKELIDTLGASIAIVQTTNSNIKDYSPFYGYMKQKKVKLYRTMDQDGPAMIQDITGSSMKLKLASVKDVEPYEVFKTTALYDTTKIISQKYERFEIVTPKVIPIDNATATDAGNGAADADAGTGAADADAGTGAANTDAGTDASGTEVGPNGGEIITDPDSVQTTETVIESWFQDVTQQSKLTRDTVVYRDKQLELGKDPSEWVQTKGIDAWAQWYNDNDEYYWVYVNTDGNLRKGWSEIGGQMYYFNEDGILQTGWAERAGKKVYLLKEDYGDKKIGTMMTGWFKAGDGWHFFDADGGVHEGWLLAGNNWYYCVEGLMLTGMHPIGGKFYIFEDDGKLVSTRKWVTINGVKHYTNSDGSVYQGWMKDSKGKWYYLNNEGTPTTGWVGTGTDWYYLGTDGVMVTGEWINDGKYWYYMHEDGAMAKNEWIDGYWLSGDGAWTYQAIGTWRCNETGWWFEDTLAWYPKSTWQKINNEWYYFKSDVYLATSESIDGYWVDASGKWVQ